MIEDKVQNDLYKIGDAHVAIIGGGIAGLSAAWYLQQYALESGLDINYTVLEQSNRWGGKIVTEAVKGPASEPFIVEAGPDSFLTQKPWGLQLAQDLGLDKELLPTNDEKRTVFVVNNGRPTPFPDGVLLIVPTKLKPFALSPLLSIPGKLRMGLDLLIPPKRDGEDETLAEFISRRLGREALDKIAEPLMSGIYNSEAEKQSLLATFPRFRKLEETHGSLIKGMLSARRNRSNGKGPVNETNKAPSMFMSFRDGTETLVQALVARLTGDLRLETGVNALVKDDTGYRLKLNDGADLAVDAVIIAVPAYIAAKLIGSIAPKALPPLNAIRYVSTGTISLAFHRKDVNLLDGFGLVIPRSEQRLINAVTQTSTKFDRRAPSEFVLIRVFFGGSRNPQMMDLDNEKILAVVQSELKTLLDIEAQPIFHRIYRWYKANPQYDVGHLDRVKTIESALPNGLYVTGSAYKGIGIPDCVHQGQQTAKQVVDTLLRQNPIVRVATSPN